MIPPTAQTALAALALVLVGVLALALVFHAAPAANKDLLTFALGALSGALTVGGAGRPSQSSPPFSAKDPAP